MGYLNNCTERDSVLKINGENYVIHCTTSFRNILDQKHVFTTLACAEIELRISLFMQARMLPHVSSARKYE